MEEKMGGRKQNEEKSIAQLKKIKFGKLGLGSLTWFSP